MMRDVLASRITILKAAVMRTTLDIADDVLLAAKARAAREKKSLGQVISELARQAFQSAAAQTAPLAAEPLASYGIQPLPSRGTPITTDLVQRLQDQESL